MFCHLLIYLCVNVFKKIFLTVTDKICGTFMVLGIFNRRDNDMQLGQYWKKTKSYIDICYLTITT